MIDKSYFRLCNIFFNGLTKNDIFNNASKFKFIITANSEIIVKAQKDERLRKIINENIVTLDGQIPYWLFRFKYRNIKAEKISGSDFIYDLCEHAKQHNKRVFLLGGYQDSNTLSVQRIREKYNIEVDGYSPPYEPYPFSDKTNALIIEKILQFRPNILLVGFGAKKQEFWIDDNKEILKKIGIEIVIGVGGTFDFVSGKIKRAPKFIQNLGLEGLWRLIMEPKLFRLKRLLVSSMIFYYFFKEDILR
ncbi:WecB/TagA/CpsF family glycosyltransferase [Sulfurihydrogenibium sp.]|uniref:WecB/TagA/CpsF family glycosyltransferase n=1 Tax=Sulfurihydrogenibium sp. TaxID=2053621 RepID=UPI0026354850|nr:WecB/TagA/CpsF family glycosyltransferase [Sulfurihydrogenibium sp.]